MNLSNCTRITMVFVGVVAAMVLGGRAKADFTFGEPVNLGSAVNGSASDSSPCISADGLSLYFTSDREGGYGTEDIWLCTRPSADEPWGPPENLGPMVNTEVYEDFASISTDGLELYFGRAYWAPGTADLVMEMWVTKRADKDTAWGQPVKLELALPEGFMATFPSLSGDGLELYFSVFPFGDLTQCQLYVAKRETRDAPWGQPASLGPVVNSWNCQAGSVVSPDGLLLLFTDWWGGPSRPGGFGDRDVWFTRRSKTNESWQKPMNLGSPINTRGIELCGAISADGSTLYHSSPRPGGQGAYDLWQAPILPVVDFDRDGKVALSDLMLMVESWGTDDPLCDIGPMPWGDGVVDEADLEVLMEHWGQEVNYLSDPRQAAGPAPADQSISDVEHVSPLRWVPGRYSAQHDVFLGTDPVRVAEADLSDTTGIYRGRQEGNEYILSDTLLPGQTFYWRIDEFNPDTPLTKGQVWSFSVGDYLVVDDMEASDAVWTRWFDGWDDPNNGSVVEDEFTMVHAGAKSMHLYYDNNDVPISQVQRSWETPQDWTRRGVDTLTLWLRGSPDNTAEPLQVRLVDSAGNAAAIVHPDPAVLLSDGWQQWSIPLTEVTSVDLTAIQSMAIVIGDDTTEERGTGEVYIDDICLSPVSR
jgi:hypothetical protein